MSHRSVLAAVALALATCLPLHAAQAASVFLADRAAHHAELPDHARATATAGRINPGALNRGELVLDLPGAGTVVARVSRVAERLGGGLSWVGTLEDRPGSLVSLTLRRGELAGFVDDGERLYEIAPAGHGLHLFYEVAADRLPALEPEPPTAPEQPGGSASEGGIAAAGAGIVQDLMVLYTPASRARWGVTGIENRIISAVEAANQAYLNSQVDLQLNLVHVGEIPYTETGVMEDALNRLTATSDGYMDEAHALRDSYGADVVSLVDEDGDYCGIGWVMRSESSGFAGYAFNVTYSNCLTNQTLAHEIGHNQGNMHDRASSGNPGVYPYSYGFRRCMTDGTGFRTVMAYSCSGGTRIHHFSNPAVSYNGFPTGIDHNVDSANSADAARSMNLTADTVAAFRAAAPTSPPAAPGGLSAVAASHNRIDLGWSDNSADEAGFRLERSADGVVFSEIATLGANVAAYADTGLAASTSYTYRVRAYNGAGSSGYSNTASATTQAPPPPPAVPADLAATALSSSQIRVSWSDVAGETGYRLERSASATGPWSTLASLPADTTGYTDAGLAIGSTWHYRLAAYNDSGDSPVAGPVSATTLNFTVHLATGESHSAGTVAGAYTDTWQDDGVAQVLTESESGGKPSRRTSEASHSWQFDVTPGALVTVVGNVWMTGDATEDSFLFEYSVGAGYELLAQVSSSSPSGGFSVALPSGTSGAVTLRARDSDRSAGARSLESLHVDRLVIVSEVDPGATPPAPPGAVTASALSSSRVRVTWTDGSDDESGFRIERSVAGAPWESLATKSANATSHDDTLVQPNTGYRYRVGAFNGAGSSAWIESGAVTTPDGLSLAVSAYKVKGSQTADLQWSGAQGDVTVLRDGQPVATVGSAPDGTGSHTDAIGAKGGGSYAYQVCDAGTSRCSDTVSAIF